MKPCFEKLKAIEDFERLAANAHYRVSKLARECGVSRRTLLRYFVECKKTSPSVWMEAVRWRRAQELAHQHERKKEISNQLGYRYPTNYHRACRNRSEVV